MLDDGKVKNLYKSVKERYFKGKSITANDFDKLTEFLGHVYFAIPAIIWLQDRIKRVTSPSYFCQFSYVGNEKTPTDLLVKRQASGNIFLRIIYYLYLIDKSISSFKNLRYLRPSIRERNSSISNDLSQEHLTWTTSRTCYICRSVKLKIRIHRRLEPKTGSRWNE